MTPPNAFIGQLSHAIKSVTGREAQLSTSGGTSDARFIKNVARVVEFGLVGKTMHKADEHVALADIHALVQIYERLLGDYFA